MPPEQNKKIYLLKLSANSSSRSICFPIMSSDTRNANSEFQGFVSNPPKKPRKKFPAILHFLLEDEGRIGKHHGVLSWCSHGRAFRVHEKTEFVRDIMPNLFRHSRWASFQRQLNLYGFTRILAGNDKGAYYHPLFLRGKPSLCDHIVRGGTIESPNCRKVDSALPKANLQPDFYSVPPIGEPSVMTDSKADQSSQCKSIDLPVQASHLDHLPIGAAFATTQKYMKLDTESYCSNNKAQMEVKFDELSPSSWSPEDFTSSNLRKEPHVQSNFSHSSGKLRSLPRSTNAETKKSQSQPDSSQIPSDKAVRIGEEFDEEDAIRLSDDPQELRQAFAICGSGDYDFDIDRLLSLPDWFQESELDW